MTISPYFSNHRSLNEQTLLNTLAVECIQQRGMECLYIPKSYINADTLLGDNSSAFQAGVSIECLIDTVTGFDGSGEYARFMGLDIQDNINIVISKTRFYDLITSKYSSLSRPMEGDIIAIYPGSFYVGQEDGAFLAEIVFLEDENPVFTSQTQPGFYQLGTGQVYNLRCQRFRYTHESLTNTGDDNIVAIETTPQPSDSSQIETEADLIIDFTTDKNPLL